MAPADPHLRWIPSWLDLVRTHTRLWAQVEADMQQGSGLSMARFDVLTNLNMAGGRMGLTELANAIVLSPSGLSKLLDRMELSGLIAREADPADARSVFAVLTEQGRRVVAEARKRHHAFVHELFGRRLSDADLASLSRIMRKL